MFANFRRFQKFSGKEIIYRKYTSYRSENFQKNIPQHNQKGPMVGITLALCITRQQNPHKYHFPLELLPFQYHHSVLNIQFIAILNTEKVILIRYLYKILSDYIDSFLLVRKIHFTNKIFRVLGNVDLTMTIIYR